MYIVLIFITVPRKAFQRKGHTYFFPSFLEFQRPQSERQTQKRSRLAFTKALSLPLHHHQGASSSSPAFLLLYQQAASSLTCSLALGNSSRRRRRRRPSSPLCVVWLALPIQTSQPASQPVLHQGESGARSRDLPLGASHTSIHTQPA